MLSRCGWTVTLQTQLMRVLFASLFVAANLLSPLAWAHQVGASVQISPPGVYGRIEVGGFPQILPPPQVVVLPQPVIVTRPVYLVQRPPQPIYAWVPPGHRKHWDKHCYRYRACGQPVYLVPDDGYGRRRQGRHDDGHHHRKHRD
jgi:hypothetical protein